MAEESKTTVEEANKTIAKLENVRFLFIFIYPPPYELVHD